MRLVRYQHYLAATALTLSLCSLSAQVVDEIGGAAVFEAEDFNANISRSSHTWTPGNSVPVFSGSSYMEALPNNGANITAVSAPTTSPELQFTVNFATTGNHYCWMRLYSNDSNDNSVHVGFNGAVASTLQTISHLSWQWVRTGPIAIPATGNRPFSIWMAEDGIRVDRIFFTTSPQTSLGNSNAWHIPDSAEATGGATMRSPLTVNPGVAVTIYNGNQFQGTGAVGTQIDTGSKILYRKVGDSAWSSAPMSFSSTSGNNKYYAGLIPNSAFGGGDTIQYYLRIWYNDHLPAFLYGTDSVSHSSEFESDAQATPYVFTVRPLQLSIARQAGGYQMSWQSQLGVAYRIQWRNALTVAPWQSITPDFIGTGATMNFVDDGSQTGGLPSQRFYEIVIP